MGSATADDQQGDIKRGEDRPAALKNIRKKNKQREEGRKKERDGERGGMGLVFGRRGRKWDPGGDFSLIDLIAGGMEKRVLSTDYYYYYYYLSCKGGEKKKGLFSPVQFIYLTLLTF